ncbi:MAG TPA: Holliday junction branch migration DNA helicase RuvB, partial [Agitococcus sp.]|nr:Holliday junction branch migration DNA helicase RuvB [Agitococcus sp.]
MAHDRIIAPHAQRQEEIIDRAIRPTSLADYIGQPKVREQMEIFIHAAKTRGEAL